MTTDAEALEASRRGAALFVAQCGHDKAARHLVEFFLTMSHDKRYLRDLAGYVERVYPADFVQKVLPMAREALAAKFKDKRAKR